MDTSRKAVIIGGSLSALMSGIVLTRLGYDVELLEQETSSIREEQGAGISLGPDAREFFTKFDRLEGPYSIPCPGVSYLGKDSEVTKFWRRPMFMSAWTTMYYRLKSNLDGEKNAFFDKTPTLQNQGKAVMQMGAKVTNVSYVEGKVNVEYTDILNARETYITGDLVIVADGASSTMRDILLPGAKRTYSGYLGWRGVVLETEMSEKSRNILDPEFTSFVCPGGYICCYLVPGINGSLERGARRFNWVWYSICSDDSTQYKDILTDSDGRQHRNSIPRGKMRDEVWEAQRLHGNKILNAVFAELVNKTKEPFLSVIHDYSAPRASFFDGKVLMIGDALALFRPHMGLSVNQSAVDCLLLERMMKGEISLETWEKQVIQYGLRTKLMNAAFGAWYIYGGTVFLRSLLAFVRAFLPF